MDITEYSACGQDLERFLFLRSSPIAVKFLEKEEDIPAGAIRPKKDRGYHLALCQAFAMTRRQGMSIAMLKEDHWCWAPLIGYGLVPPAEEGDIPRMVENPEAARELEKEWPRLAHGKYAGTVIAPLKTANFVPDLVLVYSNTAQMRTMLMAIKYKEGRLVASEFDPIDSCVFSTVPVMLNRRYRLTLPDPGEFQRGMAGEDEIILSVPSEKLGDLVSALRRMEETGEGYTRFARDMRPDFPRPGFYKKLFKKWGLDAD